MTVTAPSPTSLTFRISTATVKAFQLNSCLLGAYAFNTGDTSYTLRSASFTWGSFNSQGSSSYTNSDIVAGNTFLGCKSYHIKNQGSYHYALAIGNNQARASTNITVAYMEF